MKSRDVLVLGGGAAGLMMAHALAREKISFAVIEERLIPALATSARSRAIVNLFPMDNPIRLKRSLGEKAVMELLSFYRTNLRCTEHILREFGIPYRQGVWNCPTSALEVEELQATSRWLVKETSWQPSPLPSQAEGLFVRNAISFQAASLLEKLAKDVAPHLFLNEKVLSVQKRDKVIVQTTQREWQAEVIIVCLNAYTPQLFPEWDKLLYSLRAQSFVASFPPPSHPVLSNFGHEIDFPEEGQIWVGGINPYATFDDLTYEEKPTATFQQFMEQSFQKRWGRTPKIVARSAGIIAATPTGFPLIGRLPGRVDLLLLTGFNARGWCAIPAGAVAIASLLQTGSASLPALFAPAKSLLH